MDSSNKAIRIAAWATTGIFVALMTLSGVLFVSGPQKVMENMHMLGYPDYFVRFLGLAKLLGVAAILARRTSKLREWAYAGFTFVLLGALVTHAATGTMSHAGPAVLLLALLSLSNVLRNRSEATATSGASSSIWFGRVVLAAASLLLAGIALKTIGDPIGTMGPRGISLGTPAAVTVMRVSGGVFLGIAATLVYCLFSVRRLRAGLGFLLAVAVAILAVRLLGLVLDGPAPFTLQVLKPEIALVLLSAVALVVEGRRTQPRPEAHRQFAAVQEA